MKYSYHSSFRLSLAATGLCLIASSTFAADTDIYGAQADGANPNVVFLLDNTSNWSSNNQDWNSGGSWDKCKSDVDTTACKALIEAIYYQGISLASKKRPWESGYNNNANKDGVALTQGQVQLRALKLVLNELVCSGQADALQVNVGLSMIGTTGSILSNGHSSGFINFAVQHLQGTANTTGSSCQKLIQKLDTIDAVITNPTYKAPSNANYGSAYYEIFKYFGGHTNPTKATESEPNGTTPISRTGYGPDRFSNINSLDDPDAFVNPTTRITYKSPIGPDAICGNNFIVLVGNTYPNAEANNGGPTIFKDLGYTPPTLSAVTSDTNRFADEWSYFLANTDVSPEPGIQRVMTYAINTYNAKPDADQTKLLKSMAAVGGLGGAGYIEVGGDLEALVEGFRKAFINIAATSSSFTATTLPVSTTTQGTYLNQVFVGMFRPVANGSPRWLGNLKQYELGLKNGVLELVDATNSVAIAANDSFFQATAKSFWTESSVFFTQAPSGTPPSASDAPDGSIVEKGGAAQMLRKANLQNAANRKVYTLPASPTPDAPLSNTPFSNIAASPASATFTATEISWIRGEANIPAGDGAETFVGSYSVGNTVTPLGATGVRPSIHGDVLHSRPVALNYGEGDVVVFYGANDGFFRAVDGRKTGITAGQELWSFIAPEHYGIFKRLRQDEPLVHLPETNSAGGATTPPPNTAARDYAMDGPIGVYARYTQDGSSLTEAFIYPAMRRGGRTVYALDVTDKTAPKFLWKISNTTTGYSKLAQTWSMPKPVLFNSANANAPVLLFMGGGYDEAEDANNSDNKGNVVYVINGRTGALIKALDTDYAVPSDISVADIDGNGIPDRLYFADIRGNLYRVDLPALTGDDLIDKDKWNSTSAVKIASLGGKVFYAPDVVVTSQFVAVMIGTGDREKPLLNTSGDNFFLIKDTVGSARSSPLEKGDLSLIATVNNTSMAVIPASNPPSTANGCYIKLATNGEKVVNAPFTIGGATYFGTNRPKTADENNTICSADLGRAFAYQFPLFCGTASSVEIKGGGLPPTPVGGVVLITMTNSDGTEREVKMPFLIGGGQSGSPFRPSEPKPPIAPTRSRLYWRVDNLNR